MAKVDLGLVGVFPWTDLDELYYFPNVANATVHGGYKVIDGVCYIDVYIAATGNASVTLPAFKSNGINNTLIFGNYTGIATTNPSSTALRGFFGNSISEEILGKAVTLKYKALGTRTFSLTSGKYVHIMGAYETTASNT